MARRDQRSKAQVKAAKEGMGKGREPISQTYIILIV